MSTHRFYVTTAIPYVNGDPHLGHALELVQADVLARHRRLRGDAVRFLTGTDDNAMKNVAAAREAGVPVAEFVAAKASRFAALRGPLELSYDDFLRTSADPRHRPAVERLWRACADAGDLYERDYEGLYCGGCEAFLAEDELDGGRCAEHGEPPERVAERNWFFRLSRHRERLLALLEGGGLRIEPEHRRNETLALVRAGLADFSVSRPRERAAGWGIPVPGDPGQVVYVWFDALANYVSALDFGGNRAAYREWWCGPGERVHVIGKGILRFHAVYWPAILLSAGQPLPTALFVHEYVTVEARKLGKSLGNAVAPDSLAARYGSDALRWWLLRDVPRAGDADFREAQLAARANELADGLGNLVNRTIVLVARFRPEGLRTAANDRPPLERLASEIDAALERFDPRAAGDALWCAVTETNRFVSSSRPWDLAAAERAGDARAGEALDAVLTTLDRACRTLAHELRPFLPGAASRIERALERRDPALGASLFAKVAPGTVAGGAAPEPR
ncbi:MAG: methionine--tRNA ligase [Thermoleophilia bacterium]|nr:methionine--tRNA ligase [Thermoleophilia bacterium]